MTRARELRVIRTPRGYSVHACNDGTDRWYKIGRTHRSKAGAVSVALELQRAAAGRYGEPIPEDAR